MSCGSTDSEGSFYQLERIGPPASLSKVANIFTLKQDVTLIGRAKGKVDFYMDSLKNKGLISRIHARIFRSKTQSGQYIFKICDTSLNGTYINDVKILNEASLFPGDRIAFGHLQGAALQAGKSYSQPDSEFHFQFKKIFEANSPTHVDRLNQNHAGSTKIGIADQNSSNDFRTPKSSSNYPDLPVLLETPTFLSSLDNPKTSCPTKRELVKNFENSEKESDFDALQEYAAAASLAAEMQNDSDEELFSIKYTSLLPGGAVCKLEDGQKSTETKRKRKKTWKLRGETSPQKTVKNTKSHKGGCQALKCLNPTEKIIPWVQCDDCDGWYHIKCAGVSFKLVKSKNAKFHCGCL